jgi:hypothetical protein
MKRHKESYTPLSARSQSEKAADCTFQLQDILEKVELRRQWTGLCLLGLLGSELLCRSSRVDLDICVSGCNTNSKHYHHLWTLVQ